MSLEKSIKHITEGHDEDDIKVITLMRGVYSRV